MKNITAQLLLELAQDRFITVTFVKKDGSVRKMNGRFGVHKGTKGNIATSEHIQNLLVFRDVHKREFRHINVETILSIKSNGKTYTI
jgi:hypothetical protein